MRPIFDGIDQAFNSLMWDFLVPFPVHALGLVEEIERVERGKADEWIFESPGTRITCTPEFLLLEDVREEHQDSDAARIEMSLGECKRLGCLSVSGGSSRVRIKSRAGERACELNGDVNVEQVD